MKLHGQPPELDTACTVSILASLVPQCLSGQGENSYKARYGLKHVSYAYHLHAYLLFTGYMGIVAYWFVYVHVKARL